MTYDAALAYIARSYRQERHSLDHVRGVLRLLGDPQNQYKIIHIAGTNGKGSTCAMLHSILRESGLRTGLYTSPHLIKFNERIAVCGQIISDEDFAALTSRIQQASKRFFQNDFETLSFFEILTAMAFLYFYIQRVDAAVIEVGLGGRLDATNVIESPLLSVITAIGYDHTEVLGRTLAKIANEKGGIIKKNTPVILYLTTEQVYNTIKEICMARNADLYYFYDSWKTSEVVYGAGETVFSVSSSFFSYHGLRMRLLGEYQVFNASHALLCVEVLRQKGLFISECHIRQGLWKTLWPGRMELLRTNPLFFLDGAHNPDGAQAFCRSIQPYCRHHRLILIIGLLAKKEAASFIREVENFADVLWLTQPVSGKGTRAEQLAEAVSAKDKPLFVEPDFRKAVQGALAMARAQDVVAAVGSLYLAGDIKKYFTEAYEDD